MSCKVYKKETSNTGCAAISSASTLQLPHNYLGLSPPAHAAFVSLQVWSMDCRELDILPHLPTYVNAAVRTKKTRQSGLSARHPTTPHQQKMQHPALSTSKKYCLWLGATLLLPQQQQQLTSSESREENEILVVAGRFWQ